MNHTTMNQNTVEDLERRGISVEFFLDQYTNMKRYSKNLDSIMLSSDKTVNDKDDILLIIQNEETKFSEEVNLRNYGIIEPSNVSKDEASSFDQLPSAMKYMQFLLSKRYPTKKGPNTKSRQANSKEY